jgi:hypothetical protein
VGCALIEEGEMEKENKQSTSKQKQAKQPLKGGQYLISTFISFLMICTDATERRSIRVYIHI